MRQRLVEREDNHIKLSISHSISSITFKSMTTSAKSLYLFIFITKAQVARFIEFSIDFSITSMNSIESITFTSSRHYKFTCMSSSNSSQTSTLKHQESHRKSYFIINDLFEIFAEKSSKRNMNIDSSNKISVFIERSIERSIKLLIIE